MAECGSNSMSFGMFHPLKLGIVGPKVWGAAFDQFTDLPPWLG
eukprot:CAMPEP_0178740500 /NCGR_PEP_ID=MMETSP0744-20121128/4625_1 /TAXON_ID=913974 /ORGANISM="Nitzschia punctata, Strain CCMP561" /LENGTH=42 /DNA_ID= /DNA_START= /DNA_END= /DNA_ORIENTATION=